MLNWIKKYKRFIPEFVWEAFRLRMILKSHLRVAQYWDCVLAEYDAGRIESVELRPKKQIADSERVIWQYWGQGVSSDVIPEFIQLCFDSVDKYRGEYKVIRLSDATLHEYVDIPQSIMRKYKGGIMGTAHFSDFLRIALLSVYGGVWLDATILLTAPLTCKIKTQRWFLYQRDNTQEDKKLWQRTYAYYFGWHKDYKVTILNSIIFAKRDSQVINDWVTLLAYYWNTQDSIIDYFFFQIMINQYLEKYPERNCQIESDCLPNMLQCYFTGSYRKYKLDEILKKCSIHKLSYKTMTVEQLRMVIHFANINFNNA